MAYKSLSISNQENINLFIHHWPVAVKKAQLFIVHGYAEHGYRYDHVAKALNEAQIEVFSYDQLGHGRSGGLQAYVPSFEGLVDDVNTIIHEYKDDKVPSFLFGHSMGGLVAVKYCLERNESEYLSGLITSGAALKIDKDLSPLLQKLAPILGKILPKLKTEPLDKATLTRSEEVLDKYMKDPLVYTGGTRARTGAELLGAIKKIQSKFEQLTLPYLGMHGTGEKLADPEGTKELYDRAQTDDKTLKLYEGLYHELVNEPEQKEVIKDMLQWMSERI